MSITSSGYFVKTNDQTVNVQYAQSRTGELNFLLKNFDVKKVSVDVSSSDWRKKLASCVTRVLTRSGPILEPIFDIGRY